MANLMIRNEVEIILTGGYNINIYDQNIILASPWGYYFKASNSKYARIGAKEVEPNLRTPETIITSIMRKISLKWDKQYKSNSVEWK